MIWDMGRGSRGVAETVHGTVPIIFLGGTRPQKAFRLDYSSTVRYVPRKGGGGGAETLPPRHFVQEGFSGAGLRGSRRF